MMNMLLVIVRTCTMVADSRESSNFKLYTLKNMGGNKMSEEVIEVEEKTIEEIQAERIAELEEQVSNGADPEELKKAKTAYKNLLKNSVDRRPAPKEEEFVLRKAKEVALEFRDIEHGTVTNRAYVSKVLEYRNSHIAEFGTDPFTDFGASGPGEANQKTIKIAEGLQNLLDKYPSDSLFNAQMQEYLKDDTQLLRKLAANSKKNKK